MRYAIKLVCQTELQRVDELRDVELITLAVEITIDHK